jgi:hypothetical protein
MWHASGFQKPFRLQVEGEVWAGMAPISSIPEPVVPAVMPDAAIALADRRIAIDHCRTLHAARPFVGLRLAVAAVLVRACTGGPGDGQHQRWNQ